VGVWGLWRHLRVIYIQRVLVAWGEDSLFVGKRRVMKHFFAPGDRMYFYTRVVYIHVTVNNAFFSRA
jgi:hypothetical protein